MNYAFISDHSSRPIRVFKPTGSSRVTSRPFTFALSPQNIAMKLCYQDNLVEVDINVPKVKPNCIQLAASLTTLFVASFPVAILYGA